jgi:pyruvate formate lyase activating enzyme
MFFPMYKMMDIEPTPEETLAKAKKIVEKYLDYVYVGNEDGASNTSCRKCSNFLIRRHHCSVEYSGRKCSCGNEIARVF